jgi:hypothetical protein
MPRATAAALKTPQTAKVTETILRKEVREPIDVDVKPPEPSPEPSADFWRYIELLSDDDWKEHTVTLYRYPLAETKPNKLGRYIKTYGGKNPPLRNEDQIFDEFGGSQYDAMLKGPSPNGGTQKTLLAKHSWEMDGPAKNPWQAGTPGVPPSSDLAGALQVLLPHLQTLVQQRGAGQIETPAVKESLSVIKQLTDAIGKPQTVTELVKAATDLQNITGGSRRDGGLRETLALLHEFGVIGGDRGGGAPRRSLAQEIKEVLDVMGSLGIGGGGGSGGGGGRVDWPTALVQNLPGILEKVTPIADKFADAARSNARVAELRSGRPVAPSLPPPTTPAPTASAAADRVPAAESPASASSVAAPETEPATTPPRVDDKMLATPPNLNWVKARTVQMFGEGKPGDVVAEFLDLMDAQLGAWLGSMDAEKFRAFVKEDPILKAIESAPRFPAFVRDFVGYFQEEEEPVGTSETPPA